MQNILYEVPLPGHCLYIFLIVYIHSCAVQFGVGVAVRVDQHGYRVLGSVVVQVVQLRRVLQHVIES